MFGNNWFPAVFFAAVVSSTGAFDAWGEQPPAPPQFDTMLNQPAPRVANYPPRNATAPQSQLFAPPPAVPPAGLDQPRPLPPPVGDPSAGGPPANPGIRTAHVTPADRFNAPPIPAAPAPPPVTVFKAGQIIAWVGDQPIQAGDLLPMIEQALAPHLEKVPPEELESHRDEIEAQKDAFLRQALSSAIETKLLYLDFLRSIPADKLKEALPNITAQAEKAFYEKQLPDAMKKAKVDTAIALDAKLKEFGSSLEQQKRMFVERALGQSVLSQHIDYEREVTHQEMLDFYRDNEKKFYRESKAQWEKLSVLFDRFPSKSEAWAAAAYLGNEVLRGAPFEAVAKRNSQDIDAQDGGFHDWTTKGSLASKPLDDAIFSLPVGRLSERIEDDRGFHIVRVVQRQDASLVPFVEAQVEIREEIRKQKIREQGNDYIAKLKKEIPVWTVFDDEES